MATTAKIAKDIKLEKIRRASQMAKAEKKPGIAMLPTRHRNRCWRCGQTPLLVTGSRVPVSYPGSPWRVARMWHGREWSNQGGSALQLARFLLAESQDGREGFVDAPLLVRADPAHQIAKPSDVDCADLLN